jgi:hypothetical protein
MGNGLTVHHEPLEAKSPHRRGDGNELSGPVSTVARPEADLVAVLESNDAEAIVLQLVEPVRAWNLISDRRLARSYEPWC